MLDLEARKKRLRVCQACQFWAGRCLKAHPGVMSNLGCPVNRFPPLGGAVYATDRAVMPKEPPRPCGRCGPNRVGRTPH